MLCLGFECRAMPRRVVLGSCHAMLGLKGAVQCGAAAANMVPCHAAAYPCHAMRCCRHAMPCHTMLWCPRATPTTHYGPPQTAHAIFPCSACSPVVPGKDSDNQAELALQSYKINPVCKEHMPGMAWAHPHQ